MMTDKTTGQHWTVLRILGWGGAAAILLAPLIAMQFTSEVNWTGSDFLMMGVMLLIAGGLCEVAVRTLKSEVARLAACALVGAVFFLTWAELAVGIFH